MEESCCYNNINNYNNNYYDHVMSFVSYSFLSGSLFFSEIVLAVDNFFHIRMES